MIQVLPMIFDTASVNLPTATGATAFFTGPAATGDDTLAMPLLPVFAGAMPFNTSSARRFGSSFLIWNQLAAFGPYGVAIRGSTGKMPDESEPARRRNRGDDPDSRDVPGEGGRTGPNHKSPNYDSPGSGSGGEPGLGGGAGGNVPI